MRGDGDGWTSCADGHRHWGLHGAAGLLVRASGGSGDVHVLLQHRAPWSHDGDTWGVPGGARDSHETPTEAALREAAEEAALDPTGIRVRDAHVDDHGGWCYVTVVADADELLATRAQRESVELRWVPEAQVAELPLHSGFASSWPALRAAAVWLYVDAANVVGSRPDGWWRDRAGAAERLLTVLARLRGRTVRLPDDGFAVLTRVIAVVEGRARVVPEVPGVEVVRAAGSGDDALVSAVRSAGHGFGKAPRPVVVSADRGLRARLPEGVAVAGPRWLLSL